MPFSMIAFQVLFLIQSGLSIVSSLNSNVSWLAHSPDGVRYGYTTAMLLWRLTMSLRVTLGQSSRARTVLTMVELIYMISFLSVFVPRVAQTGLHPVMPELVLPLTAAMLGWIAIVTFMLKIASMILLFLPASQDWVAGRSRLRGYR